MTPTAPVAALCLALALTGVAPAALRAQTIAAQEAAPFGEAEAVELFTKALRRIRGSYLEPMSDRQLAEIAIAAMAERDRYSKYLNPADVKQLDAETRGEMTGIGIRYRKDGERVRVADVLPGSPADKAGMRTGDALVQVEGRMVSTLDMAEVGRLVRGREGVPVRLTLERDGAPAPIELIVERASMTVPSVRWGMAGRVGYIRIARFDRRTSPGVGEALAALRAGSGLRGIVLDLRDNPGGLVRAAVDVADAFLGGGTILTSLARDGNASRVHVARPGDESGEAPLVVLINNRSASSAEILAGALQDHGRAVLVGTKSFGKGVIQNVYPLPGGSAVKLTVARYQTPAGHAIHQIGIAPDVIVDGPESPSLTAAGIPDAASDQPFARALKLLDAAPGRPGAGAVAATPRPATAGAGLGTGG